MQTYSGYFVINGAKTREPEIHFEREGCILPIDTSPDMDMELILYQTNPAHIRSPHIQELPADQFKKTILYGSPIKLTVMMVELDEDGKPIYGKPMFKPGEEVSRPILFSERAWLEKGADRIYLGNRDKEIKFLFRLIEGLKKHGLQEAFGK